MLTSKKFTASLNAIRKADDVFRGLIADTLAFAIFHARNHGQKTPFMELQAAAPGWLQKHLKSVPLGKVAAKRALSEENAEHEAAFRVAEWFATHEEQKAIRAANRKAKAPTAPKAETVEPETVEPETVEENVVIETTVTDIQTDCALIVDCQVVEITEEEATALASYLKQLRAPQLKVA